MKSLKLTAAAAAIFVGISGPAFAGGGETPKYPHGKPDNEGRGQQQQQQVLIDNSREDNRVINNDYDVTKNYDEREQTFYTDRSIDAQGGDATIGDINGGTFKDGDVTTEIGVGVRTGDTTLRGGDQINDQTTRVETGNNEFNDGDVNVGGSDFRSETNVDGSDVNIEGDNYEYKNEAIFMQQGRAMITGAIEGCLAVTAKQGGFQIAIPGLGGIGGDSGESEAEFSQECAEHAKDVLEQQYGYQIEMGWFKSAVEIYINNGDSTVFDKLLVEKMLEDPMFYAASRIVDCEASAHIERYSDHNDTIRNPEHPRSLDDSAAHRGDGVCNVRWESLSEKFHGDRAVTDDDLFGPTEVRVEGATIAPR